MQDLDVKKVIERFSSGQSGAVTVDYVVLVGAAVWLGVVVLNGVAISTLQWGSKIDHTLSVVRIAPSAPG